MAELHLKAAKRFGGQTVLAPECRDDSESCYAKAAIGNKIDAYGETEEGDAKTSSYHYCLSHTSLILETPLLDLNRYAIRVPLYKKLA